MGNLCLASAKASCKLASVFLCALLLIHSLNSSRNDLRHGTSYDCKYFCTHPIPAHKLANASKCTSFVHTIQRMVFGARTALARMNLHTYVFCTVFTLNDVCSNAARIHHFGANVTNRQCAQRNQMQTSTKKKAKTKLAKKQLQLKVHFGFANASAEMIARHTCYAFRLH